MARVRLSILIATCLALLLGASTTDARGRSGFLAFLNGYQEVPSVSTKARGTVRIDVRGDVAFYTLSYDRLEGEVLFAHIHFGQSRTNGGVIAFLCSSVGEPPVVTPACPDSPSGSISGTLTAGNVIGPAGQGIEPGEFEEFLRALRARSAYVNVHSDKFPGGEIRGTIF